MADESSGWRATVARRRLTPVLTSSLAGTAELPPFIFFSTSYPELDFDARLSLAGELATEEGTI